jgi:hypothetical protein
MEDGARLSLEQIRAFLEASEEVRFEGARRQGVYDWITRLLRRQSYRTEGKVVRGLVRRYVAKMTGRSRAQVTRLIGRYLKHSEVRETSQRRHRFESRFGPADIELLARVDEAHETLSGPATKKILEREWKSTDRPNRNGWRRSRRRTFTTRGSAGAIASAGPTTPRRVPCRWLSGNGAGPNREVGRAICGWTRCIQETWTESRA